MSTVTKVALAIIVIGSLWLAGRAVFSEKTVREIGHNKPYLLQCDECQEMFTYNKIKWSAREYPASEWRPEYRSRNDCLECGAKWTARIIGEGTAKDYVPPDPKDPEANNYDTHQQSPSDP